MEKENKPRGGEYTLWDTPTPVPVGFMRQFRYMALLYERIKNIPGAVVECGLGRGGTLSMLAYLIGSENPQAPRILYGFDSFEGFPEPHLFDQSPRNLKKGEWNVNSQTTIREHLELSGVIKAFPKLDVHLIPGFVEETIQFFPDQPIAFIHLDLDLYEGYRTVLEHLFPKMSAGAVILFDDYKEFTRTYPDTEKFPGATKAVDDYFSGLPYRLEHDVEAKKYFLFKEES